MTKNICLILIGVVVPGPILRVQAIVCIKDEIVDEYAAVVALEQDLNRFVLLPGQIVEVVALAELVDLKRSPDGIVEQDD